MKSTEVYRTLRAHLAPVFKNAGFRRTTTMLSWVRPQGVRNLIVWCQVSRDGWDFYAGSGFVLEFQLSDEPIVGARSICRQRLAKMLDANAREQVRAIQNGIVSSLKPPPPDYPVLHISESVSANYLAKFRSVDQPYGEGFDIWLRYRTEEHVTTWAQFIISVLPACLEKAEGWG